MKITTLRFCLAFFQIFVCRIQTSGKLIQFPESPDGEEDPYPEGAPIDDHLMFLIITGLLIGAYFLIYKRRLRSI